MTESITQTLEEVNNNDEDEFTEFEDFIDNLDRCELAKSRNDVDIVLWLKDQEKLSIDTWGEFRITTVNTDPPDIQFMLISICDYNIRCPKENVQIEPMDSYTLQCSVKCKEIGVIVCPFHFRFTKEGIDNKPIHFSIIRQLEVYVCKNIEFYNLVKGDIDDNSDDNDDDDDDDDETVGIEQNVLLPTLDITYSGEFPSYPTKIDIPKMFLDLIEERKNLTKDQRDRIKEAKKQIEEERYTKSGFVKHNRFKVYERYYLNKKYFLALSVIGADFEVKEDINQIHVTMPSSRPQINTQTVVIFNLMIDGNMISEGFESRVQIVKEYQITIGEFNRQFYHYMKVIEKGGNIKICLRFFGNESEGVQTLKNLNLMEKMPYILDFLIPNIDLTERPKRLRHNQLKLKFINQQIAGSELQEKVVYDIVEGTSGTNPYLVVGVSGVGKTTCLLEAALQICIHDPSARILLCCHSNNGTNELAKLLHFWLQTQNNKTNVLNKIKAVRFVSKTFYEKVGNKGEGLHIQYKIKGDDLNDYHIVMSNMDKAMTLQSSINPYFSHVFLDELSEAPPSAQFVIAGNLKKTGSLVLSGTLDGNFPSQINFFLHTYVELENGRNSSAENEPGSVQLIMPQITDSSPYYTRLKPFQIIKDLFNIQADNTDPLAGYCLKTGRMNKGSPIFVHGVIWPIRFFGSTADNLRVLQQILQYLETFLSSSFPIKVEQKDIGITTFCKRQAELLKEECIKNGWQDVDVGTCQEMRRKAKKRIVISSYCWGHMDFLLPQATFYEQVGSKMLRQATSGLSKSIIIGNPHTLQTSPSTMQLFNIALKTGCYMGPPVPHRNWDWFKSTNAILDS